MSADNVGRLRRISYDALFPTHLPDQGTVRNERGSAHHDDRNAPSSPRYRVLTEYYGSHFASRRLRSEHRHRPSGTRPFVNAGAADMFQAVPADRRCRSAATLAGSRGWRDRGRARQLTGAVVVACRRHNHATWARRHSSSNGDPSTRRVAAAPNPGSTAEP